LSPVAGLQRTGADPGICVRGHPPSLNIGCVFLAAFLGEWRHVLLYSTSCHLHFERSRHCSLLSLRLRGTVVFCYWYFVFATDRFHYRCPLTTKHLSKCR